MGGFVCARVVRAETLDLEAVRFDPDLTWAVVFYNGDGTVYGRYGTRSSRDGLRDVSLDGFKKSLRAALALHQRWPADRAALAAKHGPPARWRSPRDMTHIRAREGRGCIHCHHLREAELLQLREEGAAVPERSLWPFPHPRVLGLEMDPLEIATVSDVLAGSPAQRAGLRKGDRVVAVAGQPVVSVADLQWALHQAPDSGTLRMTLQRGPLELTLAAGWRGRSEFTWRQSSLQLRTLVGFRSLPLAAEHLARHGLKPGQMALRVKRILQQPGMPPLDSGLRRDDVIVSVDGRADGWTESALLAYVLRSKPAGSVLALTVRRGAETLRIDQPIRR